ncbi:hypothetical protein N431DRAFT_308933, partial [Stipitochalara longipes BDJ]
MFRWYPLVLLSTLIWNTDANFIPRALPPANTTSRSTATSTRASSVSVLPLQAPASLKPGQICCFVVQDVVSEEWWEIFTTSSTYEVVNQTQITAHLTPYPTTTITSYEIHVQTTNASFPISAQIGVDPIALFGNGAPHPTEVVQSNTGTALITGGITM